MQTVWTQIRPDKPSGLIWNQTVWHWWYSLKEFFQKMLDPNCLTLRWYSWRNSSKNILKKSADNKKKKHKISQQAKLMNFFSGNHWKRLTWSCQYFVGILQDNGVARTLKKLLTSKGGYWINQWFFSIASLFIMGTSLKRGSKFFP